MKKMDTYSFENKKALIRVDFNVPLNDQLQVTDDTRIRATLPTINKILSDGGSVILMSHLGRPKGGADPKFSLKHLMKPLSELLGGQEILFAPDCISQEARNLASKLQPKQVLLLENLRFYEEEKKGDESFAQSLSELGDVWVNDAFGTAHRAHASTAVIAKFFPNDKLFGYVIEKELESINQVLDSPQRPFTAILGGAKVSSKIGVIENLLEKVDNLLIGTAMCYTFVKAEGGDVGASICEDDYIDFARKVLEKAKSKGVNVYICEDSIVTDSFEEGSQQKEVLSDNIPSGWKGVDMGKESLQRFQEVIEQSATVLWNGPVGVFEIDRFAKGSEFIAKSLGEATQKRGTYTLIGGGDCVAAVNKFNQQENVSYMSTGGGALLEYIEGKKLPGIEAVLNS